MLLLTDIRIFIRSKQCWLLNSVLFSSLLTVSSASALDFSASTDGSVQSGPFTQLLSGVLINTYDLNKAGLSNSILQEQAIAEYTFSGVGPANFINLNQTFSIQVGVNNIGLGQPNINMNVSGNVTAAFLTPPTLYGPFTVQQLGNVVPPIPIEGPNNGLVAETHKQSVIFDAGPITIANPPVATPPLPVVLSNGISAGPTPGGAPAIDFEQIAAITFLHEISVNGGAFQPYGFVEFIFEEGSMPILVTDFDSSSLVTNPTPDGFDIIGIGDLARQFPINPTDNFVFRHTLDAQLRTEVIGTPEPTSTFSFLALGTIGTVSTLKRKLKPSKKDTTKIS